jgi:hypothetical protein
VEVRLDVVQQRLELERLLGQQHVELLELELEQVLEQLSEPRWHRRNQERL